MSTSIAPSVAQMPAVANRVRLEMRGVVERHILVTEAQSLLASPVLRRHKYDPILERLYYWRGGLK